jgi:hypothetical protein
MASQRFLLCRSCRLLHPSEVDGFDLPREDLEAVALELRIFRSEHAEHGIEEAMRLPGPSAHDRPMWDPMASSWFQVTARGDTLLVRGWRTSIDEPRHYNLEPSPPPVVEIGSAVLDVALVRRALDRHFFPQVVSQRKIDAFVGAASDLVGRLDPMDVETSYDDADVPNAAIGPLPDDVCDALLHRCAGIFDEWELQRVRGFVEENRDEYGVLAVRVHRQLALASA